MESANQKYHRHSIRLEGYDYTKPGWYYITICSQNRVCYFGKIFKNKIILSQIGMIAKQCLIDIPKHFPTTELDEFIIMPNHLHAIIIINDISENVRAQYIEPVQIDRKFQNIVPGSLSSIIRSYKAAVTRICKESRQEFKWHRNFYEHIIRNEKDLFAIRNYIHFNGSKWLEDENFIGQSGIE